MENVQAKILYKITPSELRKYGQKSVYFTKPRLVSYYESNYDEVTPAKRIPYFIKPTATQYPFDLNDGYEPYRRLTSAYNKHIELSLKYGVTSMAEGNGPYNDDGNSVDSVERTMIYTRRGSIAYYAVDYVQKHNSWSIKVSCYNGNIYMVQKELDESEKELKKPQTHHIRFEKIIFAGKL